MQTEMVKTTKYTDGSLAVLFWNEPFKEYTKLSVNIESISKRLKPGEFCVKNWSENTRIAEIAFASGLFEDTGERVSTGYVQAPIWRLKE